MAAISSGTSLLAPPGPSRAVSYHGTRSTTAGRANSPPLGSSSALAGPSSPPTVRPRAATSSGATPARIPQPQPPALSVSTKPPVSPPDNLRLGRGGLTADALKSAAEASAGRKAAGGRARSASIVSVTAIRADYDDALDTETLQNINADWVNFKGAWLIHVVLIAAGKVLLDIMPGISQEGSWTLLLQGYTIISYLMFHYVTGTPFDAHGGALDQLTLWEQIDHGAQYTPAKKWLTSLPIVLFLLSTHYTRYDRHPTLFMANFLSLILLALAPKLPQMHRLRIRFFQPALSRSLGSSSALNSPGGYGRSGPPTPICEEPETPVVAQLEAALNAGVDSMIPPTPNAPLAASSA